MSHGDDDSQAESLVFEVITLYFFSFSKNLSLMSNCAITSNLPLRAKGSP